MWIIFEYFKINLKFAVSFISYNYLTRKDWIYIYDINSPSGLLDGEGACSISSFIVISCSFEEPSPVMYVSKHKRPSKILCLKDTKGAIREATVVVH